MRLRDVLEDLKSLAMILSGTITGTINNLEMCYKRCHLSINEDAECEAARLRQVAEYYLKTYVLGVHKELEEKKYADDEEVLHSIEESAARYRRLFLEKIHEKKRMPKSDSAETG